MRILVILQTMYSGSGIDTKAPLIFKINPFNKSGKKMLQICGEKYNEHGHFTPQPDGHSIWFSNISSIQSGGGAESFRPLDLDFVTRAVGAKQWDLIIFGGSHSKEVFWNHLADKIKCNVILMPHPASRNFTNTLKMRLQNYIKLVCPKRKEQIVEFQQLPLKEVKFIKHKS